MTAAELIAEGEMIVKPAYLLGEFSTEHGPVGYWSGIRDDMPNETPAWATALAGQRHLCTVSEDLLLSLDLTLVRPTGPVSLFEVKLTNGDSKFSAKGDYRLHFRNLAFTGSTPLYAVPFNSFPPFAALCCHGGERIGAWLAAAGYARHDYWQFHDPVVEAYEQEWMRRSPFYHPDNAVMIVGGWHFLWPEDDFYTPPECRMLFLTLRDAEPWYEVWHGAASGGLTVRQRIT